MCQLTLMKTQFRELLAPSLISILLENSDFKNKDGAGMFSTSAGVIKTEKHFSETSWRQFFSNNKSDTILAHVRAATISVSGKREITLDNSHPYQVDDIVLAHNGSLKVKADYKPKAVIVPEETDSLAFLKEVALYRRLAKTSFVPSIKEVMKNYTGKFAFLAYADKNYYAIRGKSAPLHKCTITFDGTPVGLIINTEERDLKKCLPLILHLFSFFTEGKTEFVSEEIPKDTINLIKGVELEQVDTIEENDAPVVVTTTALYDYGDDYSWGHKSSSTPWYKEEADLNITLKRPLAEALDILKDMKITPELFDKWSLATIGRPVLTLEESELCALVFFIDDFSGMVQSKDNYVSDFLHNKAEAYALIRTLTPIAAPETIHWPYELNSIAYLRSLLENGGNSAVNKPIML